MAGTSQGSAATYLRCGGIINDDFIARSLPSLREKNVLKIDQQFWRSYRQEYSSTFLKLTVASGPVFTLHPVDLSRFFVINTDH